VRPRPGRIIVDLTVAGETEGHAVGEIEQANADPPALMVAFGGDSPAQLAVEVLTEKC
jgi:hypothetical protein